MITVRTDDRIRLLSSILALIVGNEGIVDWAHPHPLRLATQRYLEQFRSHPCVSMVGESGSSLPAGTPLGGVFYQIAFLLKGPPNIEWDLDVSQSQNPKDELETYLTSHLENEPYRRTSSSLLEYADRFPSLLSDFFEATRLNDFWDEHAKWWEEAAQQCNAILSSVNLSDWLRDFYGETGARLFLVPNLTDPSTDCYFCNGRDNRMYAVIGPPSVSVTNDSIDSYHQYASRPGYVVNMAFHEFSHGFLNPFLKKDQHFLERTEHLRERNSLRGWFPSVYASWESQFEEIFIRTSTALFLEEIKGESESEKFLTREKKQHGIYAIDEIYETLKTYYNGRKDGTYGNLTDCLNLLNQLERI